MNKKVGGLSRQVEACLSRRWSVAALGSAFIFSLLSLVPGSLQRYCQIAAPALLGHRGGKISMLAVTQRKDEKEGKKGEERNLRSA